MSIIFSYTPRHKKSTTPLIFGCARLPPLLCVLCVWGGDLHAQLFFLTGSRAVPVLFRWYLVLVLPRTSTRERSLRGRTCTRSPTLSHLQRHKNPCWEVGGTGWCSWLQRKALLCRTSAGQDQNEVPPEKHRHSATPGEKKKLSM